MLKSKYTYSEWRGRGGGRRGGVGGAHTHTKIQIQIPLRAWWNIAKILQQQTCKQRQAIKTVAVTTNQLIHYPSRRKKVKTKQRKFRIKFKLKTNQATAYVTWTRILHELQKIL